MALIKPKDVKSPRSRIRNVDVIYDGTEPGHHEFSIAKLELHNDEKVIGIRWDRNSWSDNSEEIGYPSSRGYPAWFILPDIETLLATLIDLNKKGYFQK